MDLSTLLLNFEIHNSSTTYELLRETYLSQVGMTYQTYTDNKPRGLGYSQHLIKLVREELNNEDREIITHDV